jgi:hypothetical protein
MAPDEDGLIPRPTLYEPEPPWLFECDFDFTPSLSISYSPRWYLDALVGASVIRPDDLIHVTGI